MKRKILMILMSFVLVGCGKADVPSFDDANTTDVNGYHTYYNMDKLCAQLERVDKKYDMTDPQDMMNQVDYVFVGTMDQYDKSQIYDNGKIKKSMKITIKKMIKGQLDQQVTIWRDGGSVSASTYANYPKETLLDKGSLEQLPDQIRSTAYVEVVPEAYFRAQQQKDYLFFVKEKENLEVYNLSLIHI